jgi:hypothetical protein
MVSSRRVGERAALDLRAGDAPDALLMSWLVIPEDGEESPNYGVVGGAVTFLQKSGGIPLPE